LHTDDKKGAKKKANRKGGGQGKQPEGPGRGQKKDTRHQDERRPSLSDFFKNGHREGPNKKPQIQGGHSEGGRIERSQKGRVGVN